MKVTRVGFVATLTLALIGSIGCLSVEAQSVKNPPLMGVDPNWPKPLPNGWVLGQVGGTCIDANDHVFVVTRGFQTGGLTAPEGLGGANPTTGALGGAYKSKPAPPVVEFYPDGTVANGWGDASLVPAGFPPPVGTNRICGRGPLRALIYSGPPNWAAGKTLTMSAPAFQAVKISVGVMAPGITTALYRCAS